MKNSKIYQAAEIQLTELYKRREKDEIVFHSLERLLELVDDVKEITSESGIEESQELQVILASYFIYSGFWSKNKNPIEASAENLRSFLQENEVKETDSIISCLKSVTSHDEEKQLTEKIIYDAYYGYLGKKKILRTLEMKALEITPENSFINTLRHSFDEIKSHKFRTSYAIQKFGRRKARNIQKIQSAIDNKHQKIKKKKRKSRKLGRGIETMYRSIYRNHINLSSMADTKANLIIRINTVIISIIVTLGGTGFTFFEKGFFKYTRFTVPVIILLMSALAAVVFALLSARPKVTNKEISRKKLLGNESSVLFFGNFVGMQKKDFLREMRLFKQNTDRIYDSMTIDIYYLGLVLDKKYRLVKVAYNLFMCGLVLSVLSFVVIFMYLQLNL